MEAAQIDLKIKDIVIRTLRITDADYTDDLTAGDHPNWDSIGHVNLLMAIEQGFGIAFDVTDAIDIESVDDLQVMVRRYIAQKNGTA